MNLSFREYVKLNMDKAYNHQKVEVPQVKVKKIVAPVAPAPVKEKDVFDYLKEINPKTWTARIVQNKKEVIATAYQIKAVSELNRI